MDSPGIEQRIVSRTTNASIARHATDAPSEAAQIDAVIGKGSVDIVIAVLTKSASIAEIKVRQQNRGILQASLMYPAVNLPSSLTDRARATKEIPITKTGTDTTEAASAQAFILAASSRRENRIPANPNVKTVTT